jgi:hypothetical protein
MKKVIEYWHTTLNMPKHDLSWHLKDIKDETQELKKAEGIIHKWSELSDVVYTYTRAQWSGHENINFPFSKIKFYFGLIYMFPKYTLRWKFFRVLGKRFDKKLKITEVRNPEKIKKLENIAIQYNLDPIKFTDEAKKMMRYWFFLK